MTSSSEPGRSRGSLSSRLSRVSPGSSSRRASDPEERFQRFVTLGFIGLIAAVGLMIVAGLVYGFWDSTLRPIASVAGTGISRGERDGRVRLEEFRLARSEGRVRTALAAGTIDEELANTRLTAIAAAQQGLGVGSLERLIDLIYQQQLAADAGLVLTAEDLDAALVADGARPASRRVSAVIIRPQGQIAGLPATPEDRQAAFGQAQAAVAALAAGTAFDQVVAEFGTDGVEAGGDLGVVERSDLQDAVWADALFNLDVGGVTDLISADDGSYLIGTVTEILPEQPDPTYLADVEREVGADVNRRNVELEALAAKLEEKIAEEATAGEVDQVRLAEILIEGDAFSDPEADEGTVRASHILYSPNDEPGAGLAEDDPAWETARLEAEAAAEALRAIVDPAERATALAARAREESDDPTAAVGGGDLGYFSRATMVPEFADPLFDYPNLVPGQIVGPVRSAFGWHVISFTDRRAPTSERLAEIQAALAAPDADFASVARERSDGAEAPAGGETGWHTLDELGEEARLALVGLTTGERTEPVASDAGYVIYQKLEEAKRPLDPAQAARARRGAFPEWYQEKRFAAEDEGLITQDASILDTGG